MNRTPTDTASSRNHTKLKKWRLLIIVGAVVIFIGSSIPSSSIPSLRLFTYDKLMHLLEYGAFGLLLCAWARREFTRPRRILVVLAVAAIYAASDEFHQLLVGRSCEFYDWVADMAGVTLAIIFSFIIDRFRGKYWNKNEFEAS